MDVGVGEFGAEEGGELAVAVEAHIVEFDDGDFFEAAENGVESVGERMEVAEVEAGNFLALSAEAAGGFLGGAGGAAPTNEEDIAALVASDFRRGDFVHEAAQFIATPRGHFRVELGAGGGVAPFIVFQAGDDGELAAEHRGAGRGVGGGGIERVRPPVGITRSLIERGFCHPFGKIWLTEGFHAAADGLVGEDDDGATVLAGNAHGFHGDVETILDILRREDDARGIPVAAVDRLHEIGLLDVRRQARAGSAALDVDDDEGDFRHDGIAEGLHFQREAGTGTARHCDVTGVGETNRHGDGRQFILSLHEEAAVAWQLRTEGFHDRRPRRDGIARAVAHACGQQATDEHLIAIRGEAVLLTGVAGFQMIGVGEVAELVAVATVEGQEGHAEHVFLFLAELALDDALQFVHIQLERLAEQAEHEEILALVLGRAADGFHGGGSDRHADVMMLLVF